MLLLNFILRHYTMRCSTRGKSSNGLTPYFHIFSYTTTVYHGFRTRVAAVGSKWLSIALLWHPLNVKENWIINFILHVCSTLFESIDMLMLCHTKRISIESNKFILMFRRNTLCFNDWITRENFYIKRIFNEKNICSTKIIRHARQESKWICESKKIQR